MAMSAPLVEDVTVRLASCFIRNVVNYAQPRHEAGSQCRPVATAGENAAKALADYLVVHGFNPTTEGEARDPHFTRLARARQMTPRWSPCSLTIRSMERSRVTS
ncbi:hypothetical protein G6O67_005379 [Ophiocordyceps sinensis]|uniref:Uncharacterized protein n=1 Tax=Ophiocordyceps sinensis TaxID=72228 RepID=A0A8H4V5U7_9HYPO|nr:hypothetical protein G6O67_005379 [Ophiocordyceps sinensis]